MTNCAITVNCSMVADKKVLYSGIVAALTFAGRGFLVEKSDVREPVTNDSWSYKRDQMHGITGNVAPQRRTLGTVIVFMNSSHSSYNPMLNIQFLSE